MSEDSDLRLLRHAAGLPAPITDRIGYDTYDRPFESWYAYVSRLIRVNAMSSAEARAHVPKTWLDLACDPFREWGADAIQVDPDPGIDNRIDALKLSASAWIPFPELCSLATECLRGCPTCLANGYHSYATQSDLFATCPVHKQPLVQHCPHCNSALYWHGLGRTLHAFQCPSGCSLTRSHASGLIIHEQAELEAAWSRYLHEVDLLNRAIVFRSGPTHISYPPSTGGFTGGARSLPAPGLLAALCGALAGQGSPFPALDLFNDLATTHWRIALSPWTEEAVDLEAPSRNRMLRGFRRSSYWTTVPLPHPAEAIRWLYESIRTYGPWLDHYATREDDGIVWLDFPSYLLTNREVAALRLVLGRDPPAGAGVNAASHYQSFLVDLLRNARTRRVALDSLRETDSEDTTLSELPTGHSDVLSVSDRVDAIFRTSTGLWRLRAWAVSDALASRRAWIDYRDPAELGDDTWVHIERREDAF
jgi:hypothetical protein